MAGDSDEGRDSGQVCPHCGNTNLTWDHAGGEIICTKCGAVVREESFDRGPEWRSFNQEEKESRSRGGPPVTNTLHDKGLSTEMDYRNRDAKGKNLPPERRTQVSRLRKWNRRSKTTPGKNRYLRRALSEIKRAGSQLQLPKTVQKRASDLYRKASEEDLIKGKPMEDMIVAALYEACKWIGYPRTFEELCEVLPPAAEKRSKTSHRKLMQNTGVKQEIVDLGTYIPEICRKLNVPNGVRKVAHDIIEELSRSGFRNEGSDRTLSAAIVYLASLEADAKKRQGLVENASGVSRAALKNAVDKVEKAIGKEEVEDE